MFLKTVQVTEFQSIRNSNPFDVGDITCLVGKNESGKTALLQALYRLNPVIESEGNFDVVDDYPRSDVEDYQYDVEQEERKPATVIRATFELEDEELDEVKDKFGASALSKNTITLTKGYEWS